GLGLIGFVCAVGAQASLVRAAIMGMLVVVSSALGRPSAARNAIVFAAVVMVLVDPFILTDDIGFQLSFLATIGIVIFYPRLEVYAESLPTLFGVREAFLLTVSAQLLVTPLLVWHFGRLSFIAPIVNAVVAPFIPFIMLFGALGAAGAFIAVPLGQLLGLPAWMASQFVLWIIQYTAQVPYAAVLVPAVSIIPLFIVNGVVIWYLLRRPVFLIANK
ncbi:MAG: ComEC/Rec2 family competence protein, partial [Patescibacteria group bacterium]